MGRQLTPKQSLSKAYRQLAIETADFEHFKQALKELLETVEDGQKEETQKGHLTSFLTDTFYKNYYIAPEGDIDLAIRLDKTNKSNIGLLIEVKSTTNKSEMISPEQLNKKALQELLLYYLRERVGKKNSDIKNLIITNLKEFFIFNAHEFEDKFYQNKKLRKDFLDFEAGAKTSTKTDFFYNEIAAPAIEAVEEGLTYTYFNIDTYKPALYGRGGAKGELKLIELYKLLSNTHLLKLPFLNDSNTLNRSFYAELLHILGLEERKESGKTLIVRKAPTNRDEASLIENTILQLDMADIFYDETRFSYGKDREEQLFNIALELCITWINRILFLKLLEAQLLRYHEGDTAYKFLSIDKVKDYDRLNALFFQILAKDLRERRGSIAAEFQLVPYLNSSLFEKTKLERKTITINSLMQDLSLPLYGSSVLKGKKQGLNANSLSSLEYLFRFLDAYNFSSDGNSEVLQEEAKTLINASVLGLIFEKINGHRDGSVYTPGFITMYICREVITKVALEKFNEHYGWECKTRVDLYNKIQDIAEANRLINSLKICDPAVGSGHFLVSALNELIFLKYELGILVDREGKLIKKTNYQIEVEHDELIVTDADGNLITYKPHLAESQRLQETLFNEKRFIIENCLFGVDINPNSVKICRLRLWIELLKNAYYTAESGYTYLETLPNIDINIKEGNSLLSRFRLDDKLGRILKKAGISINEYKKAVSDYKEAHSKEQKKKLEEFINKIKKDLRQEIGLNDPLKKKLLKLQREEVELEQPGLFELSPKELRALNKRRAELKKEVSLVEQKISERENGEYYKDAFEWRIEFPEVLDKDGDFLGFDAIIGNPPYIQLQSMGDRASVLKDVNYETFVRTGDIYCLFYELGRRLLKSQGHLGYITSNKWMRAGYGQALRQFFTSQTNPLMLIDFSGVKVFDSATVDVNILLFQNSANEETTQACTIPDAASLSNLSDFVQQHGITSTFATSEAWVILSPIEQSIKQKIEAIGTPLKDWDINIYRGVLTGCNEAFIISTEKRDEILASCQSDEERERTAELIRPILRGRDIKRYGYNWADLWIINTHNGIKGKLPRIDVNEYPAIKAHLDQYWKQISMRADKGDTPYNLRNCAYLEEFFKPKIIYPNMTKFLPFVYDTEGYFHNDKTFFISGKNLAYLTVFLNSSIFRFCFRDNFPELGGVGRELRKIFFEKIPVLEVSEERNKSYALLLSQINGTPSKELEASISYLLYEDYRLTDEEISIIERAIL